MFPAGTPLSVWLSWLETLSPKEINLGLSRVQAVLKKLKITLLPDWRIIEGLSKIISKIKNGLVSLNTLK